MQIKGLRSFAYLHWYVSVGRRSFSAYFPFTVGGLGQVWSSQGAFINGIFDGFLVGAGLAIATFHVGRKGHQ